MASRHPTSAQLMPLRRPGALSPLLAILLLGTPAVLEAQSPSQAPPAPSLSVTRVALRLTVTAAGPEAGSYTMRGEGGCQNYGDAKQPNWTIGWSAPDASELFIFRIRGNAEGKTEQNLVLAGKGKPRFTSLAVNVTTIARRGKHGLSFKIDGTDVGGRKLAGTITCASETV
ncbi:MAG TPA: hypothetical protein VFW66_14970 [Gemmatimonadales bacterium]|nr:hypothetical protein [Gemmatimonadales bacterium]